MARFLGDPPVRCHGVLGLNMLTTLADRAKLYRPIGEAMADCDGQNLIGDAFFSWRLRLLIEAGRVEAQGNPMSSDGPKNVLVRRTVAT